MSVVPILSKYSPSQTFPFTWELQAAVCCTEQAWSPFSVVVKAFCVGRKVVQGLKPLGDWRDGEAKEQTARFFASLNVFVSGIGVVPSMRSLPVSGCDSESVCARNLNTLVKIFIQETGPAKHICLKKGGFKSA